MNQRPECKACGHTRTCATCRDQKREQARYTQALADAAACRESRRVTRAANRCGCYCCTLDRQTYGVA